MGAIVVGTVLFLLPFSTRTGYTSLIDALFRATSSICVTGLVIHDTATYLTIYGQVINIILVQLGGLGIMTFSTLILLVSGRKISIKERIIIQKGFHYASPEDIKSLIFSIFLYAFSIEAIGALFFFIHWHKRFSLPGAVFHSVFHAISAFCNAGFALFSNSFESFRGDLWVNTVLILLIVCGGLGFLVMHEIKQGCLGLIRRKKAPLSLHTKLVAVATLALVSVSFLLFLIIEGGHSLAGLPLPEKLISSLFQVVTPRTAGFNTLKLTALSPAVIFLLFALMFIGASPGSTGGGVKTSTVGVIFAFVKSKIAARDSVPLFHRTLPLGLVMKAFIIMTLSTVVIFLACLAILLSQPQLEMKEVLFEVISAFGTVGLSLGITPQLNTLSKIVIILTMYVGRIGPLTFLYAFSRQKSFGKYAYVEENVMIG